MTALQPRLFGQPQTELTSDDFYTPRWVFDTMGLHFELDVASPPGGPPFVPCSRYFTQEDDGLAQPWEGRIWMNPPFSSQRRWIERFLEHSNGVALLPFSKSNAFRALWQTEASIVYLADDGPGLSFHRGEKTAQIYQPVALVALGADNVEALRPFGKVR